jgi:hypothetical protein
VEFAVPTDDTRVAKMISGYRVILVFSRLCSSVGEGFSRLCCIKTLWGIFFTVTSYLPTIKEHVVFYAAVY